jgi:hypothetical protein
MVCTSEGFRTDPRQGGDKSRNDRKKKRYYYMNRRDFLRLFLLGGFFSLFGKKVKAEKEPEKKLKEAMFWRKLDNE